MMISGWSKSKGGQAKKKALLEGMKVADTGGLETKLVLGVGSRVMVRKNIEPNNGIVNGALGHVTALRRSVDGASIQTVVVHLWATDKDAEISRTTATFQPHKTSATLYERTQFPLSPADAITVHKAQASEHLFLTQIYIYSNKFQFSLKGLTLDAILVDLGPGAAVDNLAYVALSRATAADRVFVLRLHPGVIRTDAVSIQVLNQHRGDEGLPQHSVWNDLDPQYAGARELAFSSWRRRPSILPTHAYANAPTPQSAPAKRKAGGKTPAQAVRAVHGHGTPGRSRSKSARGRPKSAGAKPQRNGATPKRPPRPPVQRQVRFRSPQPQPGAPQLDPDASLLPENLRLDAQWLIDHFTQTTAISAQNHMTTVIALQAHVATGECRAKLDALMAWLRQLEPITSQDTPQPLPQDLLNPTSFLYTCLRPLLTTVTTPADGDCLFHALWGAFRGDSSDWLVRLLRALVVGTVLRHWDFFLAVEAVANGLTPDEVLPTFCADLCDAVAAKEWALDSMLIIASYIFAREIHLYKRCYVNDEPINGQANDQSLAALQQSISARESIHILSYSLVPVPGARRPLYVIFNNANHYSTLFPTSPAAVAQLPTPLPYRGQIRDPITALLQHHQVPGVANLGPPLSLLPPPLQPPIAPPRKPGPGRKGPAQPPLARLPVGKKNPQPLVRKPLPVPLNSIPDWTAWAKSNNLSNTPNPPVPYNAGINGQLRIYRGDILTIQVDCITNAANSGLQGGGGIDGTIHAAAGPAMAAYNKNMYRKGCPVGSARSSPGFNLIAKHVIHAVGPDYRILGGTSAGLSSAATLLDSAYSTALAEAARLGATSVALPCISIGIYKFPEAQAAAIAAAAVRRFLHSQRQNPKITVVLVLWSQQNEMDYAMALPLQFPTK